jgi:phospholipid/cholesterol/gamma-HCH transport system permease protein
MGINSLVFLCATRLLAAWLVLPFMYVGAVGAGVLASYLAVVEQIGEVSSGGFSLTLIRAAGGGAKRALRGQIV